MKIVRHIGFSVLKQCMCGRGEICESRRQLVCRHLADYNRRGISSKPCLQRCLQSRDELTMKLLLLSTNGRSMDTVCGGRLQLRLRSVFPVSQILLRRDGAVDSDRVQAMIQLHIDAMSAQDEVGEPFR